MKKKYKYDFEFEMDLEAEDVTEALGISLHDFTLRFMELYQKTAGTQEVILRLLENKEFKYLLYFAHAGIIECFSDVGKKFKRSFLNENIQD